MSTANGTAGASGAPVSKAEKDDRRLINIMRRSLGPDVYELFSDDDITEVYKNPHEQRIRVDSLEDGKYLTDLYLSDAQVMEFLNTVATWMGEPFGKDNAELQGELPEAGFMGSRIEGFCPPLARAPSIIIRKPATVLYPLQSYVENGFMTENQKQAICDAVAEHQNILVVGGTGSGKTTLTNAIIEEISKQYPNERLVILEDTRELQSSADDKLQLLTSGDQGLVDLVKYTLRCAPDRILVGECRDETALHMMDAWSTGHPGGVCTLHATSIPEALDRLDRLSQRESQNPVPKLVGKSVDLVVQIVGGNVAREIRAVTRVEDYDGKDYVKHQVA